MFSRAAELDELSDAEEEEAPDVPALNVFDPETVACDADVLVLTINAAMPDPMMGGASFPTALTWQLVEVRRHPRRLRFGTEQFRRACRVLRTHLWVWP